MAKSVKPLSKPVSDRQKLIDTWSHLVGKKQTYAQAQDLDRTFAGGPADPNLGYEPQSPIEDNDEEDVLVSPAPGTKSPHRRPQPNRPKTRPLARDEIRGSTSRNPLAR